MPTKRTRTAKVVAVVQSDGTQPAITLDSVIRFLNQVSRLDPPGLKALLAYRYPCNPALANHASFRLADIGQGSV